MGKLDGKIAIITGAAGGIGGATAALFVREGAKVMLVDRDEAGLAKTAAAIGGSNVAITAADVSDPASTERYVAETVRRFGGIDILFANAGTEGAFGALTDVAVADFDRVIAINVRGVFLAIRTAAPHIVARGGGSIVCTSSIAGLVGSAGLGPYVASKHAVLGLMRTAAIELGPKKIRVNSLHPGPIENRMMRSIEEQASPGHGSAVKKGFEGMVPLGRYGTNEEMARAALFLACDDSSYCNGTTLVADGGFVTG
jgi:NAD(P)-dependent dehydrogenase (short-subunit alcohol dehydrogenase family)